MSVNTQPLPRTKGRKKVETKPLKQRTSITGIRNDEIVKLDVTPSVVNRLIAKVKEL